MVLLTVFFMLTCWLGEMERRRRMQWHVNLPDIPEHAQFQPVEHFFPHVIPREENRTG